MATALELYEALKPRVGEEAARMIAEAFPLSDQLVTKSDLVATKADLLVRTSELEARINAMEARIYRWMLSFNATLFLGLAGMIVAILLKSP